MQRPPSATGHGASGRVGGRLPMSDRPATVTIRCDACGGSDAATISESVVGGRLLWVLSQDCPAGATEATGWDRTPDEWRRHILEQCGGWRLRVPGGAIGTSVAVMKVLRDLGVPLAGVKAATRALAEEGWPGTEAELVILADRLRLTGVAASISRER